MKAKIRLYKKSFLAPYFEGWVELDEKNMPPQWVIRLMKVYDGIKILELKS